MLTAGMAGTRAVRDGRTWRLRPGQLVCTQFAAVGVLLGAVGGSTTLAVAVAGAIVLLSLAWLRPRGRWAYAWLTTTLRYATHRRTARTGGPAGLLTFVAPGSRVETVGPRVEEIAVIADGCGMTAILELGDPGGLLAPDPPPLPTLAELLPAADAGHPPVRIQLVLTAVPAPAARAGPSPIAAAYRQLTGGRVPAYGRALLAVRVLRSEGWTDDDLRHALAGLVRRLPRRLGRLPARPLGAEEAMRAIAEVAHDEGAPAREGWAGLRIGGLAQTTFRLDPGSSAHIEASRRLIGDLLAVPAAAVTVALTIGPGPDDAGFDVRVAAHDAGGLALAERTLFRVVAGDKGYGRLRRLDGEQYDGLVATLPLGGVQGPDPPGRPPPRTLIAEFVGGLDVPTAASGAGAGVVLGRDRRGGPMAVGLFRPEPTRVVLVGGIRCAQLIALRAMAVGARVLVRTARPDAWEAFVRGTGLAGESIAVVPARRRSIELPLATPLCPLLVISDAGPASGERPPGTAAVANRQAGDEVRGPVGGEEIRERVGGEKIRERVGGEKIRERVGGQEIRERVGGEEIRERATGEEIREQTAGDAQPGSKWRTTLVVRERAGPADVDAAARADLLVLQRLEPDEASLVGQALGLGDVADWLTRMRPDMIGLVNRQSVRWAVLAQTPLEHQLIGSAERAAAASVT